MIEILKIRGYKKIKMHDDEIHFKNDVDERGKVVFLKKEKANIDDIAPIFKDLIHDPIQVIIVYITLTNPALKSFNDDIKHYFTNAELIQRDRLIQNIFKHKWNPFNFRKLTQSEKAQVLKNYGNISANLLPAILPSDPVSILLGFKVDDIIEVKNYYDYVNKQADRTLEPQITYQHVREES